MHRQMLVVGASLFAICAPIALAADESPRKSSVGMPARIEGIVLPGSELEARPNENREVPVVLRVVSTYPHGTAFRYDLEYYALDPGQYDLRDYLRRKDGSAADDLSRIPIEVATLLPKGQVVPNQLANRSAGWLGGYRLLLGVLTAAWVAGLLAILLIGRKRRALAAQQAARPRSLAERLQPLVASALAGKLPREGQAQLERLLVTFWRRRLDMEGLEPAEAVARLRAHEQAGQLLRQVEAWLHKPGGADEVDLAPMLAPYRDLEDAPAETADVPVAHAAPGGRR